MGSETKIQWTEASWNPIRGCTRVSEGCRNCYAEEVAARFSGPGQPYEGLAERTPAGGRWTGKVRIIDEHLDDPLRWKKPRMVFVNSMSDLFHESLTNMDIAVIFGVMAAAGRHTFQVLTKRPQRMRDWFRWLKDEAKDAEDGDDETDVIVLAALDAGVERLVCDKSPTWPLSNVWLGVSVEDQSSADHRVPILLDTPAAVRWVSYEPALGPVYFDRLPAYSDDDMMALTTRGEPRRLTLDGLQGYEHGGRRRIDWLVCGGESGSGARPCEIGWLRHAAAAAKEAGVPVFVKQLGTKPRWDGSGPPPPPHISVATHGGSLDCFRDRKGGSPDEWPEDLRVREWPQVQRVHEEGPWLGLE